MSKVTSIFGHAGNCATVACAIHCIAMPLVISILPALGLSWLSSGWAETAMIALATVFSLMSLCWGYKTHRKFRVFAFVIAAALWFLMSRDDHRNHVLYTFIGGGCLIAANVYNIMLCKSCNTCCEKGKSHG